MTKGWKSESVRHSLARKGVKTASKKVVKSNGIEKKTEEIFRKLKEEFNVSRNVDKFWGNYEDDFKKKIKEALEEGKSPEEAKKAGYEEAEVYRSEGNPIATISVFEGGEEHKIVISEYDIYDESGRDYGYDFEPKWHSTDAWRGYYEMEAKGWTQVHEDTSLAYSEDSRELKNFDEKLVEELKARGIPVARVVSSTSNLFSSSVDYFVRDKNQADVKDIVDKLKKKHRSEERFTSTALTGADPPYSKKDKQFVLGAKMVKAGIKPKQAVAFVKLLDEVGTDAEIHKETKRKEKGVE